MNKLKNFIGLPLFWFGYLLLHIGKNMCNFGSNMLNDKLNEEVVQMFKKYKDTK